MSKKRRTRRALINSVISLIICFSMLLGTTFAWFTDEVTSANNIIKAGNLDVTMEWLEGKENPTDDNQNWKDASTGAIFNYTLWEPGYTEVRHIKIANEGTLALKYDVAIQANGVVSELADVIDVYYFDPAQKVDERTELKEDNKIDTLTNVLAGFSKNAAGNLEAGDSHTITIALKMQESAGNEYQELSIGSDFSVIVFATQLTSESDSFDDQYDANAPKMYKVNDVEYDTVEEALEAAKDGDKVYLSTVTEPITIDKEIELTIANTKITAADGVNAITVNADAKINAENYNSLVGGKDADGIYVADNVTLTLSGTGSLKTVGNAGKEYFRFTKDGIIYGENVSNTTDATYDKTGGSGIDVSGDIVIDSLSSLSAEGYGKDGYGIGGTSDSIVIKNTTVEYARGGFVCPNMFIHDWKNYFYGKKEPEGGAAIGSMTDGAVITIEDSTIKKAEGGSKAAGIGARFWTGVTVNIIDSDVTAYGGNASAGIGGSRVNDVASEVDAINITIKNSVINATGGDYAAGIGSGYDTRCHSLKEAPMNTITIDDESKITAIGGKLGAGIGTGHNVIALTLNVDDNANINAIAGDPIDECCDGAECTKPSEIGLGALKMSVFGVENEPIIGDSEGTTYEGDLFEPGAEDFLVLQNTSLMDDATVTVKRTYNTVVLEDVIADVNGNLITAEVDNTIILHNCDITLDAGEKLIVTTNGATVGQVMMHNIKVNGELLTQATAAQYLEGVNWYEVW